MDEKPFGLGTRSPKSKPLSELSEHAQKRAEGYVAGVDLELGLRNIFGFGHSKHIQTLIQETGGKITVKRGLANASMYPPGTLKIIAERLLKDKSITQERFDMYFKQKEKAD